MDSKRLVHEVFEEGSAARVPIHVEAEDKRYEYVLGDVLGVGTRISDWRDFYLKGGPFARGNGVSLSEWADSLDIDAYDWPDIDEAVNTAVLKYREKVLRIGVDRFILFKVLGPTETSESFFASKVPERLLRLGQISHRYGFAVILRLKPKKAIKVYDRISSYLLELIKAGVELEFVDAVRIADDMASYFGPVYPMWFIENHYLRWHRVKLAELYDGFHPLDFMRKSTVGDALKWVEAIVEARGMVGEGKVFFTGMPVDLIFSDNVDIQEFLRVPRRLIELHGSRWLVLATTHRPYPGRSYSEELPREKVESVRKLLL
ncbi:MAG: hypothetical protein B6U94_08880 [Thermofilum sp. ex4484_79]|nr:MAG: hypothetical protein B6U94_08880 [Thermofilum sp. ex4484_79]